MLELLSCAGFFEGHLMGDLRSSCAKQSDTRLRSAASFAPCSRVDCSQTLEQVDLGFSLTYGIHANA